MTMRTEDFSPRFRDFDAWNPLEAMQAMFEGQLGAVAAIRAALPALALAGEKAAERLEQTGRLVYVGAGTSGRIGVQDGAELGPTFDWPAERVLYAMAGGESALTKSSEKAEDSEDEAMVIALSLGINKNDVVIGLAASGTTPYTVSFLRQSRSLGALTIGIANNADTPVLKVSEHPVLLETGAEVLAGSTRMKAGTAQKIALNMLSTLIMQRLGRIYRGLMVDMRTSNDKLKKRAIAMVRHLTGCDEAQAIAALKATAQDLKLAVLVVEGMSVSEASILLKAARGHLRTALSNAAPLTLD